MIDEIKNKLLKNLNNNIIDQYAEFSKILREPSSYSESIDYDSISFPTDSLSPFTYITIPVISLVFKFESTLIPSEVVDQFIDAEVLRDVLRVVNDKLTTFIVEDDVIEITQDISSYGDFNMIDNIVNLNIAYLIKFRYKNFKSEEETQEED